MPWADGASTAARVIETVQQKTEVPPEVQTPPKTKTKEQQYSIILFQIEPPILKASRTLLNTPDVSSKTSPSSPDEVFRGEHNSSGVGYLQTLSVYST